MTQNRPTHAGISHAATRLAAEHGVNPLTPYASRHYHLAMLPLDESRYHPVLLETGGIALVLFTSPACGTCRMVEQRLPQVAPADTHLFKVDVQQATGLARAFDLFHLPALLLYRDGHFHAHLECEVSVESLRAALERALASPAEEEP